MRRRSGLTAQFVPRKKGSRKNIFLLSTDAGLVRLVEKPADFG
jgi:hypothetical protein